MGFGGFGPAQGVFGGNATFTTLTVTGAATFASTVTATTSFSAPLYTSGAGVAIALNPGDNASATDTAGGNVTFSSGAGRGAGAASSLIFRTPTVGASGTTLQSLATRLTIDTTQITTTVGLTVTGTCSVTGNVQAGASQDIRWATRSSMVSPSDGVVVLYNAAQTDFSRLCFGGTTSAFPALRRNGNLLEAVFADESNYAPFRASAFKDANNVQVLGGQGAAVADASGGATVDAEARTAINTLLARMRAHGAIAT